MKTYTTLYQLLINQNKYESIQYATNAVKENQISIVALYEAVLTPFLADIGTKVHNEQMSVWEEHIYSSIVQSIIECMHPLVFETKANSINKSVFVVCPAEELHELGSRMVADFFMLLGFDVTYVGSNTPRHDIILGITKVKPDYVAISISNFYNLSLLDDIVKDIKQVAPSTKVIVGGLAFHNNTHVFEDSNADYLAQNFQDLVKIKEEA